MDNSSNNSSTWKKKRTLFFNDDLETKKALKRVREHFFVAMTTFNNLNAFIIIYAYKTMAKNLFFSNVVIFSIIVFVVVVLLVVSIDRPTRPRLFPVSERSRKKARVKSPRESSSRPIRGRIYYPIIFPRVRLACFFRCLLDRRRRRLASGRYRSRNRLA